MKTFASGNCPGARRAAPFVAFALLASLAMAPLAPPAQAILGASDQVAGGSLLVPFFEVGINSGLSREVRIAATVSAA